MINAIEWTWTLVNAAGVLFLALVLRELWRDRQAAMIPSDTNGRRGIWVYILIRHDAFFLVVQGLFLWAGVAAILRPNLAQTDAAEVTGLLAIIIALAMDVMALLDLRDRNRIRYYPRSRDERRV